MIAPKALGAAAILGGLAWLSLHVRLQVRAQGIPIESPSLPAEHVRSPGPTVLPLSTVKQWPSPLLNSMLLAVSDGLGQSMSSVSAKNSQLLIDRGRELSGVRTPVQRLQIEEKHRKEDSQFEEQQETRFQDLFVLPAGQLWNEALTRLPLESRSFFTQFDEAKFRGPIGMMRLRYDLRRIAAALDVR